ncbi:MAG TPA: hypothetical protein VGM73_03085 [Candidatus Didemnitutus sp.]|jgi:hypothetical protein
METSADTLTKVTMNFRPDSIKKLDTIRKQFNRSNKTDANAYAIDIANFIAEQLKKGEKIVLRSHDGKEREIVFPG